MAKKIITFLLFREELQTVLANIHLTLFPEATLEEGAEERPVQRFQEIISDSLRYKGNAAWCLHGRAAAIHGLPAATGAIRTSETSFTWTYVDHLYNSYEWAVIPWGCVALRR